ncbi:LacI family DNA-binding transcriptional regulator [Amycolatopsis carbonis]|uniref:LacI family DNA-binding transcriptional regulator n=1 Tax=Amycolatopsis carbonis TaxID=715471 RepID=A0A9Y2MT78_9PSEU|nr:LacI family DNA-binding transcriptional regulator [Amycolatopsis sp. 2-15]WIX77471.1 LacI family DNA-binding transcriptional regulator [Amycolatopsis sp. 2-15]
MRITIRDVARRAEVSVATVSRALGSPDRVSEATRDRVLAVVRELGYRPSPAARSLITGKTGAIAIVVPDLGNPFFTGLLKSVQARARETGHAVLVGDSDEDPATEQELVRTLAKQADGVLLCSPGIDDATITELDGLTSLALLNRRVAGIGATVMDSAGGMREVVAHLAALGHRLAYLNGPDSSWSNHERLRGLRPAAAEHGVEIVELGPFAPRYEDGSPAADQALAAGVTAVLAYNDVMALGVLARLRDRGVDVPGELSVTGFDDLVYAAVSAPPLTTVAMPLAEAGSDAVDLLLAHAATDPAGRVVTELPTRLVVRATTARAPGYHR